MKAKLLTAMFVMGLVWSEAPAGGCPLLDEDFETYAPAAPLPDPPWVRHLQGGDAQATVVDTVASAGSRSCHFTGPGTWPHELIIYRSLTAASRIVSIEYCMRTADPNHEGVFVALWGDVGHDSRATFSNGVFGGQAG